MLGGHVDTICPPAVSDSLLLDSLHDRPFFFGIVILLVTDIILFLLQNKYKRAQLSVNILYKIWLLPEIMF